MSGNSGSCPSTSRFHFGVPSCPHQKGLVGGFDEIALQKLGLVRVPARDASGRKAQGNTTGIHFARIPRALAEGLRAHLALHETVVTYGRAIAVPWYSERARRA